VCAPSCQESLPRLSGRLLLGMCPVRPLPKESHPGCEKPAPWVLLSPAADAEAGRGSPAGGQQAEAGAAGGGREPGRGAAVRRATGARAHFLIGFCRPPLAPSPTQAVANPFPLCTVLSLCPRPRLPRLVWLGCVRMQCSRVLALFGLIGTGFARWQPPVRGPCRGGPHRQTPAP
jgi:hypothetical protein